MDVPNRRLELRFRPEDGYSKPTCGDRHSTNGFLLRVRIKKNKITQVKSATMELVRPTSTDITNVKATTSCDSENLSKNDRINATVNISRETNPEDNVSVDNLVNREKDHNVDSTHCSNEGAAEKKCAADNENLCDTSVDKSSSKKKKKGFTFDNDKYENLSQEMDYEVPRLKILGRIETEFQFTSMLYINYAKTFVYINFSCVISSILMFFLFVLDLCDFQYVPMTQSRSNPKKLECIYSLIYPTGIPLYSWLKNDVPYFLPPAVFSRMDTIQQYIPKTEIDSNPENVFGKNKKCQAGFPNYIYFSTSEVPTAAPKGIETAMRVKFLQNTHLEQVRQLFEERPIWSKNAIMYKTQFTSEQLKILLPSVAYYFMTGPWRIMWVKLGYDPRKDINARKYQTLDYRLKAMRKLHYF